MPRGSGSNRRVKRSMKPSLHGSVAISASPEFTHGIRGPSHEYAGGNNHEGAEGTVDQDRAFHRTDGSLSNAACKSDRKWASCAANHGTSYRCDPPVFFSLLA